jgi:TetR/AcrR family transcriptional repressor of multidrug resistance operon
MSAVAREAGVATGTAYVHYPSKDELVIAAYLEVKADLGAAVADRVDVGEAPEVRFRQVWRATYDHLVDEPDRARFLVQVDASPYATTAHERAMGVEGDPLVAIASNPEFADLLAPLPMRQLYDLGLGPVVRLVAAGDRLPHDVLERLVDACWRAVTLDRAAI